MSKVIFLPRIRIEHFIKRTNFYCLLEIFALFITLTLQHFTFFEMKRISDYFICTNWTIVNSCRWKDDFIKSCTYFNFILLRLFQFSIFALVKKMSDCLQECPFNEVLVFKIVTNLEPVTFNIFCIGNNSMLQFWC